MKRVFWSPEEKAALESIAGNVLPTMIFSAYNRWAKKNGCTERTRQSIASAMGRRKVSRKAEGDWIAASCIASILGTSIDVPQRWAEKGLIESYKNAGSKSRRYFRRADVVDLARKHPDLFGGIDCQRLFMLLEDEDLADFIAQNFPKRRGSGRMVQAVESGRIYESVTAAAKDVFATSQCIHSAMKVGGTCAGYHWKRIETNGLSTVSQAA